MPDRYAVLFPGQGAQYVGMGAELLDSSGIARDVFARASESLGLDMVELCTEDPKGRLNLTEYTQPALLTLSVAVWETLKEYDVPMPAAAAGLSLGEYTALVAAGSLALEDACVLVQKRGRYMQEAVPPERGAMAAIIGLDSDVVREVCREVQEECGDGVVSGANFNCPGQVVISGDRDLVDRARRRLDERGARRAVELSVSAPFHSALMIPARDRLAEAMREVEISPPDFPVVANAWAAPSEDAAGIRAALLEQVASPVLWEASVEYMMKQDINTFVEAGPGKVLRGFLRRIDRSLTGLGCERPEEIGEVVSQL